MKNFGTVLRNKRREKGLSQEALAERLDMSSHSHICRLESGQMGPTLEMVFKIAEALEMKAWELVRLVEEKDQN
ncbi:MAG: helix-turn-helix transcriptional regulator [Mailhella sp.]|nr:helix-turn-helix transcriptional regulator [Mailhella sp.]